MLNTQFDVAIIGGGPAGYVAAIRAAQLGLKTAVVEKDKIGGVCLNWGCIPTKALLKSAEIFNQAKRSNEFGITIKDLCFDFPKIIKRSRDIVLRNSKGVEYLLKKNNVNLLSGFGRIIGKGCIEVNKDSEVIETITANHIIIATGAKPRTLTNVIIDGKWVISSTEAMILQSPPKSMIIVGAGAIGVEFAYFYNSFGTKVIMVEMMPNILPFEDKEISSLLENSFRKAGIEIFTNTKVESISHGEELKVIATSREKTMELAADIVLMAVGVQGNVENIGLEAIGVKIENNWIQVDDFGCTNIEGIYAIGDVAGPPWLAHVASREGIICVEKIAGKSPKPIDYNNIPSCTYCQPQVASIGLSEEKAIDEGYKIKVGRFPFNANGKARAIGETEGLVKLIFDVKSNKLLGAHIIGADATELIAELGIAKTLGATTEELINTIYAHPTLSEAIMEATENAEGHAIHL